MRIVCLSDLHGYLPHVPDNTVWSATPELPEGDVLVIAGDLTGWGKLHEIIELDRWLATVPIEHKIIIAGNHDLCCEFEPMAPVIQHAHYLEDSSVTIDNLTFYGVPWTPRFLNWSFMLDRGSDRLKRKWDAIPHDTDVLITHGPPAGKMDYTRGEYIGCDMLRDKILEIKPKLHVFGHVHEGYGTAYNADTIFVNAAMCNGGYKPVNDPIVIEL